MAFTGRTNAAKLLEDSIILQQSKRPINNMLLLNEDKQKLLQRVIVMLIAAARADSVQDFIKKLFQDVLHELGIC